jgi:cell migration-inducing and hyaluronan-binding protein
MVGERCIGSCLKAVVEQEIETVERLWSDPATWPSGKVPVEGEDVEILPGKNILFDLEESPILKQIEINGRLTFKPSMPKLHLRARYIFVRMGELLIGSEETPF